jgi:hypothetical protein
MSILRPVLIAEVLGRDGFGMISGAVAVAPILASAAAPSVGAGLLALGGPGLVYAVCLGLAVLGLALMALLVVRGREGMAGVGLKSPWQTYGGFGRGRFAPQSGHDPDLKRRPDFAGCGR